jgi:hypothetical protein
MRGRPCYGNGEMQTPFLHAIKPRGEVTTSRIHRRALLQSGGAVFASTVAATGLAAEPPHSDREPLGKLGSLIEAHMAAYAAFGETVQDAGGSRRDSDRASRPILPSRKAIAWPRPAIF